MDVTTSNYHTFTYSCYLDTHQLPYEYECFAFIYEICSFQYQLLKNAPVRCPHCRKVSSVGIGMKRMRGMLFMVLALIVFAIALGVTLGTLSVAKAHGGGIYVAYVGAFLLAFVLASRAIYYFAMKVSTIEGPM